jgi:hypothetical protein
MAFRTPLEIAVHRLRQQDAGRALIRVRRPSGDVQTYHSLHEVPAEYRALIEGLFHDERLPDLEPWFDGESPRERSRPPARSRRRRVRQRRNDRELILTYYWLEIMPVLGAALLTGFSAWWAWKLLAGRGWVGFLPLALAGCGLGVYWFLAFLLNHTTLRADNHGLTVRHGPLPWPGSRFLPRNDIRQLYVTMHRGRRSGLNYRLMAMLSFQNVVLLPHVRSAEEALYFERAIERRLGIEDRPVPGPQYR